MNLKTPQCHRLSLRRLPLGVIVRYQATIRYQAAKHLQRHAWRGSGAIRISGTQLPSFLLGFTAVHGRLSALDLKEVKSSLNGLST